MTLLVFLFTVACHRERAGNHDPGSTPASRASAEESEPSSEVSAQHEMLTAAPPIAQQSIYELELSLTDQAARQVRLDVFRGQPVIVSMFYAGCPYACPTLISDIKRLEKQLDATTRSRVRVLLVSLDPERDTPERLQSLARLHGVDQARWRLARGSEDHVRELAAVLGLKYRKLKSGEFNHSSVITVLDGKGMIRARLEGLEQPLDELVKALGQLGS